MQTRETSGQGRKRHRNNIGRRNALAVGAAILLAACGRPAGTAETVEGFALGTVYKVTVSDKAPDSLREKVEGICAAADSSMSVFNPRSLLSRINRNETDSLNEDIIRNIELARSVSELARSLGVDIPLTFAVEQTLYNGVTLDRALEILTDRVPSQEFYGLTD